MIGSANNAAGVAAIHATACLDEFTTEEMSDDELIGQIAGGNRVAMKVLYTRHYDGVLRFVCRIVGTRHAAEDITSDVFLDVWRKAASFERRCTVSTWLFAIARNKSLGARRQRGGEAWDDAAMALIEDESEAPDVGLQRQDTESVLRKCLGQLSPAHRAVIELVYFHDKTTADAAKIVGAARCTVKTRLFYARERLTNLLGAEGIVTAIN